MHSIELLTNSLILTLINYCVLPLVFLKPKHFISATERNGQATFPGGPGYALELHFVLGNVDFKNIQEGPWKFTFCAGMIFKNSQCSFKVFASIDEFDWSCFFDKF